MFESFFDWSDEQGLPLRAWSDALAEKGIPPAALLALVLLLVVGGGYVLLNQGPGSGSVLIRATTPGGEPLPGVSVTLTNTAHAEGQKFHAQKITGSDGRALFEKVPAGSVHGAASSPDGVLDVPNFDLTVAPGQQITQAVSLTLQAAQGVSLNVDVKNVDSATITLLDAQGNAVDPAPVADTTAYSFSVLPNADYTVRAESPGYRADERQVHVADSNQFVTLVPTKDGVSAQARLHVRVVAAGAAGKPVANASVSVLMDGAPVASSSTSEDGATPALSVPYNATLTLSAVAEGFQDGVRNVTVSSLEQVVVVALDPQGPGFSGVRIRVQDQAGNALNSPVVDLYRKGQLLSEQYPDGGVALFNTSWDSALGASAYHPGFFPRYLPGIQKDTLISLSPSGNRSAQVRVHVVDFRGQDAPRVSVSILGPQGQPSGFPVRSSDSNGVQVFGDVPLAPLVVRASDGIRSVQSAVLTPQAPDGSQNETDVELQLPPASVHLSVRVLDHFSRSALSGAIVRSDAASCTANSKGACSLDVLENDAATFHASAAGYQDLDTAGTAVFPGVAPLTLELTADSVARTVRLHFDGVYDALGRKVSSLSPLSRYQARYVMVAPPVAFDKAEAEIALDGNAVMLGGQSLGARLTQSGAADGASSASGALDVPPVLLTSDGFSEPSFGVFQGGSVIFVNQDNVTHFLAFDDGQSVTIPDGQNRSVTFNKVGGFSYKSLRNPAFSGFVTVSARPAAAAGTDVTDLLFEWGPFNGSRQISVDFRTGQSGQAALHHRSAFVTPTETLKSPVDGLDLSGRFSIDFPGTCTEQLCVQLYFLDPNGRKLPKLDLPWGQSASLVVNVLGLTQSAAITVGAPASVHLLSAKTNSSGGVLGLSSAAVPAGPGQTSATFTFQGVRLTPDAALHVNVTTNLTSLFDADAFVVVFSPSTPSLFVSVKPDRLAALTPSKLKFSVKDFLGQPVDGARVTVADQEAAADGNRSGTYVLDGVDPESLDPVPFQVTADGFRPFSGTLAVQPPDQAVQFSPASLTLSVDAKAPASASLQLTNRLSDKLHVSISASVDSGGDLTSVSTSVSSLTLAGKATGTVDLRAAIKDAVIQIAKKAGTLRDHVQGNVHLRFSGKGYSDTADVPFTVDSTFAQSGIDDAWTLSPDSLAYNLEPPKAKVQSLDLTVANNAPYPMVFNVQQSLGLSVQPASLTLSAGQSGVMAVKDTLDAGVDCFSPDLHKRGTLTVFGSFQGLTSQKSAQVSLDVSTSTLSCQPPDGFRVTLPIDARLSFLANVLQKSNADGSTSVRLPSGELVWFASGTSVTPVDANIPQGTAFVLDRSHVQPLPQGGYAIAFPSPVLLSIPAEADRRPYGAGQTIVTLDNAQIILPPGVQAQTPQTATLRYGAAPVLVPPLQPVIFQPIAFNYDALGDLLPPDPVEVKLPVDATLDLLPGTTERKNVATKPPILGPLSYLPRAQAGANLQNIKAVQLPGGERLAFGDSSTVAIDKGSVLVPAGTSLYVSRGRVGAINGLPIADAFSLRMPVWYALSVSGNAKPFKTQDGQNALKVAEDAVVQATWSLSVAKASAGSWQLLRVAHENVLDFLKGASSAIPYDPAGQAICAFTFNPPQAVSFSLPKGTAIQKTADGFDAILPACDDTSRIVFSLPSAASGTGEILQAPALKKLAFSADSEFVVGSPTDGEEKSIRTSGPIRLTACLKDAAGKPVPDGLREAKVTFAEKSLIGLPLRALSTWKDGQSDVDLGTLTAVSFFSGAVGVSDGAAGSSSGAGTSLGSTKALKIISGSQKVIPAFIPEYPASGLLMPQGSAVAFTPVCEKASGFLSVTATAEDVYVASDKDGKTGGLDVTFSNKKPDEFKQKKEVCLFNSGKQAVFLDHLDSEPASSLPLEQGLYYKAIADTEPAHAYFSQPGVYGNRQKLPLEPTSGAGSNGCRPFTLEFNLPDDLIYKGSCIQPNKVPDTMAGTVSFKFSDVNGAPMATSEKHSLPVTFHFDQNPADCQAVQEQTQFQDLTGISVNYDKDELKGVLLPADDDGLFFKAAGHERFIALVNNEDSPITVSEISGPGSRLMSCALLDANQKRSTTLLQKDKRLDPAEVLVLSCVSNPDSEGKNGDYVIKFQGSSYFLQKTVSVHVWNPGALRSLYPTTPMGKAVPYFDSLAATPRQKRALSAAPFRPLSFADAPASYENFASADPSAPVDTVSSPDAPAGGPAPGGNAAAGSKKAAASASAASGKPDAASGPTPATAQATLRNLISFRLCKTYFCTWNQADLAIESFAKTFSGLVDSRLKGKGQAVELDGINALCRTLQGGKYFEKSTLMQLANVELSVDDSRTESLDLQRQARQYFPDLKEVVLVQGNPGQAVFQGCGMYRVTFRLDPACAIGGKSVPEWKANMRVELSVSKLKSCDVNLANAALLTGQTPYVYAGNEIAQGPLISRFGTAVTQIFNPKTASALTALGSSVVSSDPSKAKATAVLEALGHLRQGVLGQYGVDASQKDQTTVNFLMQSLYGQKAGSKLELCPASEAFKTSPCAAQYYDSPAFCWQKAKPVITALTAVIGTEVGLQLLRNSLTPGVGWVMALSSLPANYRLIGTASACLSAVAYNAYAQGGTGTCRELDICSASLLAGTIDMLPMPYNVGLLATEKAALRQATVFSLGTSFFGSMALQTGLGYGLQYGVDQYGNSLGGKKPVPPVVPLTVLIRNAPLVGTSPLALREKAIQLNGVLLSQLGASSPARQQALIADALAAQGVYGPQGKATARDVAKLLASVGQGDTAAAFDNTIVRAMSKLPQEKIAPLDGMLARRDTDGALGLLSSELLQNDGDFVVSKVYGGSAPDLKATQLSEIKDRLSALSKDTAKQAALLDGVNAHLSTKLPQASDAFSDLEKTAQTLAAALQSNELSPNAFDAILSDKRLKLPPLSSPQSLLIGQMKRDLKAIPGGLLASDSARLGEAFKMRQLVGPNGKPVVVTADLATAEASSDLVKGAKNALAAEQKWAVNMRRLAGLGGFFSALLFNTDFRPVQIQIRADRSDSHVVAVHSENGVPSAESLCLAGVSGACDAASGNLIPLSALCGGSSVCLRLLQWPNGAQTSYALVAMFNDDVDPDGVLLSSLFDPAARPLTQAEYDKLKLSSARIESAPSAAAGFTQDQRTAADPKDPARQAWAKVAQDIVDKWNVGANRDAVDDALRRKVQATANAAISAFNQKKDDQGHALLDQAIQGDKDLTNKLPETGGGRP